MRHTNARQLTVHSSGAKPAAPSAGECQELPNYKSSSPYSLREIQLAELCSVWEDPEWHSKALGLKKEITDECAG